MIDAVVEIGTKARRDVGNAGQVDDNVYAIEQRAPVDRVGQIGVHDYFDVGAERRLRLGPRGGANQVSVFNKGRYDGTAQKARGAGHQNAGHLISYTERVASLTERTLAPDLRRLEAESIYIFREVAAEFKKPVLLYSIGKDSSVLLHLARKAFFPSPPPFPLLHIDTTWKFREMIAFRDATAKLLGFDLIVHINREGIAQGITPFTHGSSFYTHVMKTEALKQALTAHGFDAAFGGARRDEEKSRAKERVFSFRSANHVWDPKNQRPELWHIYNCRVASGESIRVFPLSNWTELDVWRYIEHQDIPVVPLYFAAPRPVVQRDGGLIVVDDGRLPLEPDERPVVRMVRFRTLGCYPLTGAVESDAVAVADIVAEMQAMQTSERAGRLIDHDQSDSMEKKKREGYF
jgi:sulfate adenylyltransferase subunit 2